MNRSRTNYDGSAWMVKAIALGYSAYLEIDLLIYRHYGLSNLFLPRF
jgi:hypothetical protein